METMKQSGLWSSLGTHGSLVVIWCLCISSSCETRKFKFDLEGQGQLPPKTIRILNKLFYTSGPNLLILAWIGDELWCGQAQNGVNSDFKLNLTLKVNWRSMSIPSKNNRDLTVTKVFCIFGPNLVILAWTGPELSCGQASDWHTDWHTDTHTHIHTQDAGNDNTRWPKLALGKKSRNLWCISIMLPYFTPAHVQGFIQVNSWPCHKSNHILTEIGVTTKCCSNFF